MTSDCVLQIIDLYAGYGEVDILQGVNLKIEGNEIVSILGPNGAGKSTVLKAVLGLLHIRKGQIIFNGKEITGLPPNEIINHGIGYVPQKHNVFVSLTVQENLEIGAWTRKSGLQDKLEEMYTLFPVLKEKRNQEAGTLSGGQKQMVAIAKALMIEAKLLLLDEPTAGLSPKFRSIVFETVHTIHKTGIPIFMVEQNAKQALSVSDRGYILVTGSNKIDGTAADLLADREVARMFLGGRD
ncbi:MAG: ABC transporter ATP-binding protein [Alphaproteobacteria bacterium]|nr:ABC transporter ATP-binding protein [Alphaproteobacteria bacterium]